MSERLSFRQLLKEKDSDAVVYVIGICVFFITGITALIIKGIAAFSSYCHFAIIPHPFRFSYNERQKA